MVQDLAVAERERHELEKKVQEHFNFYGWKLERLEFPEPNSNIRTTFAVPRGIEDELEPGDISREWSQKLREIGKEYGLQLAVPCSVYMK